MIRLWVYFTIGLFLILILELLTGWLGMNNLAVYLMTVTIFGGLLGILVESPEANLLTIDDGKITVTNLLTRKSKSIPFETIDEFRILINVQRYSGLKLSLILLKDGISHAPISLSYIDNVVEIIDGLEKRLRNSTKDEYGLLELMKRQQMN